MTKLNTIVQSKICQAEVVKHTYFLEKCPFKIQTYPADGRKIAVVDSNKHDWD